MARPNALSDQERANVAAALKDVVARFSNQRDAAKAIGSTQQTISRVLGGGVPGVNLARSLASYMNVSFEALVGSHGDVDVAQRTGHAAAKPQERIAAELRALGLDAELCLRTLIHLINAVVDERDSLRARVAELEARLVEGR